jgi:hypothetical protein
MQMADGRLRIHCHTADFRLLNMAEGRFVAGVQSAFDNIQTILTQH